MTRQEFGQVEMSSFTPITLEEAKKFIEVSYKSARITIPELPENPIIVFTAGWYQIVEKESE